MGYLELVNEWKSTGIYPYFPVIEGPSNRVVNIEGEGSVVMLASCDYLGLSNDERVKNAAIDGVRRFGTNICGSLAFSGRTLIHRDLEDSLRDYMGTEDVALFTTAYLANLGAISTISESNDLLLYDSQNHVSLFHGAKLASSTLRTYPHNDMYVLEKLLKRGGTFNKRFIVTDGLFSSDGDFANLEAIAVLAERYDAEIIVDSAHDLGTVGPQGRGLAAELNLTDKVALTIGTMSKAFGSTGGFVAGSKAYIQQIKHAAGPFHSSRAVSPGVAAASLQAIELVKNDGDWRRVALRKNSIRLLKGLQDAGYDTMDSNSQIAPVLLKDTKRTLQASMFLRKHGVIVCPMIPPTTPMNAAILRLNVTSMLTDSDINLILEAFRKMADELDQDSNG